MIRREIELDDESDRILTELSQDYAGDTSEAVADLLRSREGMEEFLDACEEAQRDELISMRDRAELDFKNGRSLNWDEVKKRNGL